MARCVDAARNGAVLIAVLLIIAFEPPLLMPQPRPAPCWRRPSPQPLPLSSPAPTAQPTAPAAAADNFTGTAYILEHDHSRLPAMLFAIGTVVASIPDSWRILIDCPRSMRARLQLHAAALNASGRVSFRWDVPEANFTLGDYSRLLTRDDVYAAAAGEYVLIFQSDSVVCGTQHLSLRDFAAYDYVGAPWHIYPHAAAINCGNGGFSLRRRSTMLRITSATSGTTTNEDAALCTRMRRGMRQHHAALPHGYEASHFAVETVFDPRPYAVHKYWAHHPRSWRSIDCPNGVELHRLLLPPK